MSGGCGGVVDAGAGGEEAQHHAVTQIKLITVTQGNLGVGNQLHILITQPTQHGAIVGIHVNGTHLPAHHLQ